MARPIGRLDAILRKRKVVIKVARPTDRQQQVLEHISEGLTTSEIATKMKLSKKTVDSHHAALHRMAEVNNSVKLIRWALRKGYIGLESMLK